uniref:Uncharacterized protein n=1 Tax=Triticum urartu TaxID=4572 RepID=A0A8R7TQ98_TRIUA
MCIVILLFPRTDDCGVFVMKSMEIWQPVMLATQALLFSRHCPHQDTIHEPVLLHLEELKQIGD